MYDSVGACDGEGDVLVGAGEGSDDVGRWERMCVTVSVQVSAHV